MVDSPEPLAQGGGSPPSPRPAPAPSPARIWPFVVLAAAFWGFRLGSEQFDMPMFVRFMSSMFSNAIFLLVFLVLWLAGRRTAWSVRLLGVGFLIGGAFVGIELAHPSYFPFAYLMSAVPFVLTVWTIVWFALRFRPPAVQRAGIALFILLTYGYFDLVRWDGLDGRLRADRSWRWTKTSEDGFLEARRASRPKEAGQPTPPRVWTPRAGDWTEFRGVKREGAQVAGEAIHWEKGTPLQAWRHPVGPAWSSFIVVDGSLVTQEQRGDLEAVVCYDAATGQERWTSEYPARFTEGISGAGPRATPTFHEGRLYALGAKGRLSCLDPGTGKLVWSRELQEDPKSPLPQWGFSASPLVFGGKVIVFAGGMAPRGLLAFEAATGRPLWSQKGGPESYCSAQRITLRGRDQILMQDNKRIAAVNPEDGKVLWERPTANEALIPMLQAHPVGADQLLVNWGTGVALFEVKEKEGSWSVAEGWSNNRLKPSFNDFVVHEGHVYGLDDGVLTCLDLARGERRWRKGRYGYGQLLLLSDQGLLLVVSEKGEVVLVPARPEEPEETCRFQAIEGKTWNHPVVAEGCLFLRNSTEMACYRLSAVRSP